MGFKFNPFTGNFDIDNVSAVTGGGASDGFNRISAGTQQAGTLQTVAFSNSNNVSFGMSNSSVVTASASFNQSVQTQGMVSINGGTGDISFSNSNGITFGRNASTITASHNGLTSQSNQAFSASGGSSAFETLNFANSNGLTFSNSNGSVIGSYTVPTVTDYFSKTNTTFNGTNASGSITNNTNGLRIDVSVNAGGAGDGVNILAAGTQTANTTGTVKFADSNGISFGMSNSSQITASYTVPSTAGLISAINVSGGTTSNNLSKLTFADSNGISFGLNGSQLTATVKTDYQSSNANYLTSQSNQALSGSNGSFNFQTATFGNLNGMSFYTSNGSMVGSYTVPTVTDYFSKTNTTFNGANISGSLTLNTNGLQVSLSAAAPGGGGGAAISGGANSQSTGTVNFANSNGITFGLSNNGTMTASHNGITQQSTQPVAASASNGSFNFSTLNFSNANNVTFGTSAGGIVTASVAAPGAAAENNNHNLLGANTAGNTTASGSTIGLSGINLTLSGTNGSVINFSAPATSSLSATGGLSISTNGSTISIGNGQYLSRYEYPEGIFTALGQTGQGSLSINHVYVPFNVTATAIKIGGSLSAATNTSATTASVNNSLWMGIYTLNGSSLSLASSGSTNNGFQWSVGASSTANTSINSMRQMTVPINVNMTPGQYWIAAVLSQQTTYTSHGFTMYGNDRIASAATNAVLTPIGSGTTAARDAMLLQGIYTAATSAGPNSIGGNQINNTSASNVQRANFYWALYNATY